MKRFIFLSLVFFGLVAQVFAQKVSMTGFEAGFGVFSSPNFDLNWNGQNSAEPAFFNLGVLRSWHNETHKISFRKEIGVNMQFINLDLSGGGLAAGRSVEGKINSLVASTSLAAHIRISQSISADVGPTAEMLIIERTNIKISNYSISPNLGGNGESRNKGLSRDYFNRPYFGLNLRMNQLLENNKTTIGFSASYLWTPSDLSNFELPHEVRFSFYASFGRKVKG